jgi:hypothetical protein
MCINSIAPADLASLFFQLACLYSALHSKVSIVFCGIGSTPICLTGVGREHGRILPCINPSFGLTMNNMPSCLYERGNKLESYVS